MRKLKVLTADNVNQAFEKQKIHGWTFYDEREHIENLLCQRFNFLLVVYSLFITAAATVNDAKERTIIFVVGAIFILLLSATLYRVYIKLDIVLQILHDLPPEHVFKMVQIEVKAKGFSALFDVNPLIGKYIPFFCFITFVVAIVYYGLQSCNSCNF